jgi:hypothetical protein
MDVCIAMSFCSTRGRRRRAACEHGIASPVPSRMADQHVLRIREFEIGKNSLRFVLFNRMASAQILRSQLVGIAKVLRGPQTKTRFASIGLQLWYAA